MEPSEKARIERIAINKAEAARLGVRPFTTTKEATGSGKRQKLLALVDVVQQRFEIGPIDHIDSRRAIKLEPHR